MWGWPIWEGRCPPKNEHGWQAFVCEWCNKCRTTIQGVVVIGCDACSLLSLSLFCFVYSYYVAPRKNLQVKSWERVSRSQWLLDKLCIKSKYGSYVPKSCHLILTYFGLGFFPSNVSSNRWFFCWRKLLGVVWKFFFTTKTMEGWMECRGGRPITTTDGHASRFQCGAPARSKFCRNAIQPQHGFRLEHDWHTHLQSPSGWPHGIRCHHCTRPTSKLIIVSKKY